MSRLAGARVLVTRPQPQCDELSRLIRENGGKAYALPLISIEPLPLQAGCLEALYSADAINLYSAVIFVSRPAAALGASIVKVRPINVYTVGPGTAQVLEQQGIYSSFGYTANSEALVELPPLQEIEGQRILIVKGEGGRTFLKETLEIRGAKVDILDLYRRNINIYPDDVLDNTVLKHKINVIVVTSGQILDSLLAQIKSALLEQIILIVPGKRVMAIAQEKGVPRVISATGADNDAILKSLFQLQRIGCVT